jgi:uncharacterized membrane protein YoaK (UPF0700 family)
MAQESSADGQQWDALPTLLLAVTVTTGIVDAVSVIGLGNVFVALMTGNALFLGFALAGAPGFEAAHNAAALAAFLVGAGIAARIARSFESRTRRPWLLVVALVEGVLLAGAGLLGRGYDMQGLQPRPVFYALIVLSALAMGMRNATAKKLGVPDVTTTVLTLTFTGFASDAATGVFKGAGRRMASALCLVAGAFIGALLVVRAGVSAALLLAAALVFLATAAFALHPSSKRPVRQPSKAA